MSVRGGQGGLYYNLGPNQYQQTQMQQEQDSRGLENKYKQAQITQLGVNNAQSRLQSQMQYAPSARYDEIMQSYQTAASNTDNRYTAALGDLDARSQAQISQYDAGMQGVGDASRARIYRDSTAERNSVGSGLAATGLYNSTVLSTLQQGVNRNRNEALGTLDEGLRRERTQYLADITNRALDRRSSMLGNQATSVANADLSRLQAATSLGGNERNMGTPEVRALLNKISPAK